MPSPSTPQGLALTEAHAAGPRITSEQAEIHRLREEVVRLRAEREPKVREARS